MLYICLSNQLFMELPQAYIGGLLLMASQGNGLGVIRNYFTLFPFILKLFVTYSFLNFLSRCTFFFLLSLVCFYFLFECLTPQAILFLFMVFDDDIIWSIFKFFSIQSLFDEVNRTNIILCHYLAYS